MSEIKTLYSLWLQVRRAVDQIRAANDYDTACAIWKTAFDRIDQLHQDKILSDGSFKNYCDMLDRAITD